MPDPAVKVSRSGTGVPPRDIPPTEEELVGRSPEISAQVLGLVARIQALEGAFSQEARELRAQQQAVLGLERTIVLDDEAATTKIENLSNQIINLARIAGDANLDAQVIVDSLTEGAPGFQLPGGETPFRRSIRSAAIRVFNNVGGISRAIPRP